jgi:hypothetical protein
MIALIGVLLLLPVVIEEPCVLFPELLEELEVSSPSHATELAREFLELTGELMMIAWKDRGDNGWNNSITLRDCTILGNDLYTTMYQMTPPTQLVPDGHLPRTVIPTVSDPFLDGHT